MKQLEFVELLDTGGGDSCLQHIPGRLGGRKWVKLGWLTLVRPHEVIVVGVEWHSEAEKYEAVEAGKTALRLWIEADEPAIPEIKEGGELPEVGQMVRRVL